MTLGRHQITVHRTLAEFNHWSIKYRHWMIAVAETAEHDLWICIEDIRGFVPVVPDKAELRATYPRSMFYVEDGRRHFISESSLRRLLQRVAKVARHTEALKFLDWFERNTGQAAARRRAEKRPPRADQANDTLVQTPINGPLAASTASPGWGTPTVPAALAGDAVPHPQAKAAEALTENEAAPRHSFWRAWILHPVSFLQNFLGHFWRGERSIFPTFLIALLIGKLTMHVWAALLPEEADWANSYKLVMAWNVGALVMAIVCAAWFMVSMTRSARRSWNSPGGAKWTTAMYIGAIPVAISLGMQTWSFGLLVETVGYLTGRSNPAKVYADPYLGRIVVNGELGFGSSQELTRMLDTNPKYTLVEIESPGGYVIEGFRMAQLISDRKLDTVTFDHCESACTLLFASGADRYLGPSVKVGFHRSGSRYIPVSSAWTATEYQIARLFRARGVDDNFILKSLIPSIWEIWHAPHQEMFVAGFATARWSERKPGY